jgi:hypothetical protein
MEVSSAPPTAPTSTSDSDTPDSKRNARAVLAVVLAAIATAAITVHELAPDLILAIRAKVGWSRTPATSPGDPPSAAAPAIVSLKEPTQAPAHPQDELDAEPAGPAKQRPLVIQAQATRVKVGRKSRR